MKRLALLSLLIIMNLAVIAQLPTKTSSRKDSTIFSENFESWPPQHMTQFALKTNNVDWQQNSNNSSNGNYAYYREEWYDMDTVDTWFVTDAITIDSCATLSFLTTNYQEHNRIGVVVLNNQNPTSSTLHDTIYNITDNYDQWKKIEIPLNDFSGQTIYIGFYYYCPGDYGGWWGLDNITVTEPPEYDMGITNLSPQNLMFVGESKIPTITVKNMGRKIQNTFDLKLFVLKGPDTLYSDTKHITQAALTCKNDSTFSFKKLAINENGNYKIVGVVKAGNDNNPANDTLKADISVISLAYNKKGIIYSFIKYSQWYSKHLVLVRQDDGSYSPLQYFANDLLYGCYTGKYILATDENKILYLINGDNKIYAWRSLDELEGYISGITYDKKNNHILITSTVPHLGSFSQYWTTNLYSIDSTFNINLLHTFDTTYIGGITIDDNQNIYALTRKNEDQYYLVKFTTNSYDITVIEPIGIPLAFSPDLEYDNINEKIYTFLLNDDNNSSALCEITPSTGDLTPIKVYYEVGFTFTALLSKPVVNFNITDPDNFPIPNAKITVPNHRVLYSDQYGKAHISLDKGIYQAIISYSGYKTVDTTFEVNNKGLDLNIILYPRTPSTTAISNINKHISIGPNPTKDYLYIKADRNYKLQLWDIYGRLILNTQMYSNNIRLNMSNLQNGIYLLRLTTPDGVLTYRILKN